MQSKTIPGSIHFQHLLQVHCLNAYAQSKQIKEVSDLSPLFYPPCLSDHRLISKLLFSAFLKSPNRFIAASLFLEYVPRHWFMIAQFVIIYTFLLCIQLQVILKYPGYSVCLVTEITVIQNNAKNKQSRNNVFFFSPCLTHIHAWHFPLAQKELPHQVTMSSQRRQEPLFSLTPSSQCHQHKAECRHLKAASLASSQTPPLPLYHLHLINIDALPSRQESF